jgi:hypothetical protein
VLRPGFAEGGVLADFRRMFGAEPRRRVVMPAVFDDGAAAQTRERLQSEGLAPFDIADRGRYHANLGFVDGPLFLELRGFAERVVEAPLAFAATRWLRFARGDYQLIRGDAVERGARGRHLELTLDFSARETEQAEIVYTDGRDSFVVPQWPLSVALVERDDSLYRYERYLNHLVGDAHIYRLRLSLRFT